MPEEVLGWSREELLRRLSQSWERELKLELMLEAEVARLRIVEKEAAEACAKLVAYRVLAKEEITRLRSMGLSQLEDWYEEARCSGVLQKVDEEAPELSVGEEYEKRKAAWLGQPEVTDVPR